MKLTDRFEPDVIIFKGKKINLTLSFDIVLRAFELLEDDDFTNPEKWVLLARMFAENEADLEGMDFNDITVFVNAVFNNFINESEDKEEEQAPADGEATETPADEAIFDFEEDAEYIYSAFLFDYNIDLLEQQGKMHWRKFKALFKGLSSKSRFKEIIEIRTAEVPKATKENKDEIAKIKKLKRAFALKKNQKSAEAAVAALDAKLDAFSKRIKSGGR
ncbi:bacteriophage Gp15 family protein [Bacillus paralicheniformis]|uniref:bacteriophage Gp15 family protein n=1 Tax=Bacillus subtilis group TaxID=653685 RepID=UPI0021F47073|nr:MULTISPECIES: bacteriophage Gp15 family protein [Bacillus subtilis group]MCV9368914.1 bacteriophage Gp15 family protein [Bacillus paralicheniformis]MCY7740871.1 bacteriophage Gp15 family protein [Bacillus licheniformis]WIG07379.1 bacteriophage Gp15 family protein [Bacillus paralicheniformis]